MPCICGFLTPSFYYKPTLVFWCRKWKKIIQKSINQWYNSKIHTQAHTPHTHVHIPLHFTLGGGGVISSNIFYPVTFPWFPPFLWQHRGCERKKISCKGHTATSQSNDWHFLFLCFLLKHTHCITHNHIVFVYLFGLHLQSNVLQCAIFIESNTVWWLLKLYMVIVGPCVV